jgi:hypothetical protein
MSRYEFKDRLEITYALTFWILCGLEVIVCLVHWSVAMAFWRKGLAWETEYIGGGVFFFFSFAAKFVLQVMLGIAVWCVGVFIPMVLGGVVSIPITILSFGIEKLRGRRKHGPMNQEL